MSTGEQSSYDQVPYPSHPSRLTHPDHMAALSTLFGLRCAPPERCRVLEVGCGNGANLIPMAAALGSSEFTGVDLAAEPVAAARSLSERIGLGNIAFRRADIMELEPGFGEFDYVIAHGVYSWIPAKVRDKLLAVCHENLAPQGVAFVSYNTLPGCHLRRMVREMLEFQTREIADPELKLKHAFAMLNFLAAANPGQTSLREELTALRSRNPAVVYHDDLAPVNEPVYFHQFAEHARRNGLQFLAESEYFSMQTGGFDDETVQTIQMLAGADRIKTQQYLDFLKCRRFRQTLLCHEGIPIEDPPRPERLRGLYVSSPATLASGEPDPLSEEEAEFRTSSGASMRTGLPLAKRLMLRLMDRWPAALAVAELEAESGNDVLALLLRLFGVGLVELHCSPARFVPNASERPRAFQLARAQASSEGLVSTLRHTAVDLEDPLVRGLVTLLDGRRDRMQLLQDLADLVRPLGRSEPLRTEDLEGTLNWLARQGLLEA